MGIKVVNRLIRLGLILMIGISLVMSYFIWTNASNKDDLAADAGGAVATVEAKDPSEIFQPTKLIWHVDEKKRLSNREALIIEIQKYMQEWGYGELEVADKDEATIKEMLQKDNQIELTFPATMLLSEYNEIYSFGFTNIPRRATFQRFLLDVKTRHIHFVDTNRGKVYTAEVNHDMKELTALLNNDKNNYMLVSIGHDVLPYTYYLEQQTSLKRYSYILASQPYTTYTQAFFSDTRELTADESDRNDISYTNHAGDLLSIEEDTGELKYSGRMSEEQLASVRSNSLSKSFLYVGKLANAYGRLRYFNWTSDAITYQNYVEGFPVFSSASKGQIIVHLEGEQSVQVKSNTETIQVPIPSDVADTLPATRDVIAQLLAAGMKKEDFEDLQLGYTWVKLNETKQIVELVPSWYVKTSGNWLRYDQQLAALKEK